MFSFGIFSSLIPLLIMVTVYAVGLFTVTFHKMESKNSDDTISIEKKIAPKSEESVSSSAKIYIIGSEENTDQQFSLHKETLNFLPNIFCFRIYYETIPFRESLLLSICSSRPPPII